MARTLRIHDTGRWKLLRARIVRDARAHGTPCAICGEPFPLGVTYPHPMSYSVDHITPVTRGGDPYNLANLQVAHRQCNNIKNDRLPAELAKPIASQRVMLTNWVYADPGGHTMHHAHQWGAPNAYGPGDVIDQGILT